jgi:DNA-binding transcriptional LysR family regulator
MSAVAQLVRAGMGVAALPDFMLREGELRRLGEPLAGYDTALWLLTRPDCRALRSVSALFSELTRNLTLTSID